MQQAEKEFNKVYRTTMRAYQKGNIELYDVEAMLSDCLYAISSKYGDALGVISKELFQRLSQQEYGRMLVADLDAGVDFEDTDNVVAAGFRDEVSNTYNFLIRDLDLMVKRSARETMANSINRYRDTGVRFARVPQGETTCAFCLMLASRGWVYVSEESAGVDPDSQWNKFHRKCDCAVVPSWEESPRVEGYDPKMYEAIYDTARKGVVGYEREQGTIHPISATLNKEQSRKILSNIRDIGGNLVYDKHIPKEEPGQMTYEPGEKD